MNDFKNFCISEYKRIFEEQYSSSELKKPDDKRKFAQKKAIKLASINAMKLFPNIEPADIWKTIYISHVNNVSGIVDQEIIRKVISADNSWKKSSGHAFEEMIRDIGNLHLKEHNIKLLLQKELSYELHNDNVINEVRDISWLKEQISTSIFDLYLAIEKDGKFLIYGCIQSKTSIRDRVTRDREPSINAMKAFFVSFAIVLDGDFLRLPKFQNMVNGNSPEFDINGWHNMYVLTNSNIDNDRIKTIDISMESFVNDCIISSEYWTNQRQWLDHKWKP
ncbi:BsaWI family type II restriction enzyme [Winogradskyella sp.]|uniref:BsaWI family type II restriction enzyme n=1 Tax=Winogradskyella sp. TaxID=1883156 RepID=UPI002621E60E|nr:BsaWI family type II restriction enzyme [Winogradskyella sp.]